MRLRVKPGLLKQQLDEKTWEIWQDFQGNVVEAATLPIPGGNRGMAFQWNSPILPISQVRAHTTLPGILCWSTKFLNGTSTPSWLSGRTGARSAYHFGEAGDWYAHDYMYKEGSLSNTCITWNTMVILRSLDTRILLPSGRFLNWEPDVAKELIQRFSKTGTKLFIALAGHHDGFETWNLQA